MEADGYRIGPAVAPGDLADAMDLFGAYASGLGVDLSFQGFAAERAALPGPYAPPAGRLLLARDGNGQAVGCVALRPIPPDGFCEMKRLYVAPAGRGRGIGRALVAAILSEAVRIGYREMRLDTLAEMAEAIALYRQAGFGTVAAYRAYDSPPAGLIYMGRALAAAGRSAPRSPPP